MFLFMLIFFTSGTRFHVAIDHQALIALEQWKASSHRLLLWLIATRANGTFSFLHTA